MATDIEKELVEKLKGSDISEIYEALVKIEKCYLQNQIKMKKLEKYSVIQSLVQLMEHPKFCSISVNIIATGCLDIDFVNEVIKCNGIVSLVRIMKSRVNDDIQNRACHALGNMAKFETGYKAVHLMKPVSSIISFLSETSDANHQQTALHTLMVLSKCPKTKELISRENGLIYIAKLLHSSNIQVLICSIKAIANLTHNCSITCARQLLELHCLKDLVKLHSHSEESVRNHALISLQNLSSFEELRTGLVQVGAIKLFTEVLLSESHVMSRFAALALCKCLDHFHMWTRNGIDRSIGLKGLLNILKNNEFQDIHIRIIASLIPLSYEFNTSDILLNLDILQILIDVLGNFIIKNKCKSTDSVPFRNTYDKLPVNSDFKLIKENEIEKFNEPPCQKQSENDSFKDNKNLGSFNNVFEYSASPQKQYDSYYLNKGMNKWDNSPYSLNSATSDYSGSCSPNRMCSPIQKYSVSPEYNYDIDVGSPSTGHTSSGIWSPVSLAYENTRNYVNCWSPIVFTDSNSPVPENEFSDSEKSELIDEFSSAKNFNSTSNKSDNKFEVNDDSSFLEFYSVNEEKCVSKSKSYLHQESSDYAESIALRKKLKIEPMHTDNPVESQINIKTINNNNCFIPENNTVYSHELFKKVNANKISSNSPEIATMNQKAKDINKNGVSDSLLSLKTKNEAFNSINTKSVMNYSEQASDLKLLNENSEQQTVDHYVILFILQLSFYLYKKPNSQIADNSFFSILIDYLCLIHKPSFRAEIVLFNLIKNRYCLEKVILNGFFCELDEKMTSQNFVCNHHSNVELLYSNLIIAAKQEIKSDYGIGTLSHILVTSDKKGQLHGICTLSKLVTEKSSLYKLLWEANGLSLLLDFLSDSDVKTKKKAVISLCELYKTLTKQQKNDKCCFEGTCAMKTSSKCFYKESCLDVTFVVCNGAKILANREKICENSDYFKALLQGYFRESNAESVVLPEISAENLSKIFHFLHGCGNEYCCPYITNIPSSVLLELLCDCEKFSLINIKSFVEDQLCHQLSPSLIPYVYKLSKIYNSPALARRTLCSALSIDSSHKDLMFDCFKELLNLNSSANINLDVTNLLKDLLLH